MRYLSLFSGIEAASVAWQQLEHNSLNPNDTKWECVGVSEIEPFACKVLASHYPTVPNLGDVTKIDQNTINTLTNHNKEPIDLVVGGSPCQAFSLAGLRKGLEDPRGNLTLEFLRVVSLVNPSYVIWENVPGVLADKTKAFDILITGLSELGYAVEHQILDAQEFGLAQKRSRVFLVCEKINNYFSPNTAFEVINKILLLTLADSGKEYHNKTSLLHSLTLDNIPTMLSFLKTALTSSNPNYTISSRFDKEDFFPLLDQSINLLVELLPQGLKEPFRSNLNGLLNITFNNYQVKDLTTYSPELEEVTPLWRFKLKNTVKLLEGLTVYIEQMSAMQKNITSLFYFLLDKESLFYVLKEETEMFNKRFVKRKPNIQVREVKIAKMKQIKKAVGGSV